MKTWTLAKPPECSGARAVRMFAGVHLSPREREILELRARNWDCKDIAEHLGISYRTVETHIQTAVRKFDNRNGWVIGQRDLTVLFLQAQMITVDDLKFRNDPVAKL